MKLWEELFQPSSLLFMRLENKFKFKDLWSCLMVDVEATVDRKEALLGDGVVDGG